jgi:CHAT domain-containing protein/Tfp pilus assembly protein PilF
MTRNGLLLTLFFTSIYLSTSAQSIDDSTSALIDSLVKQERYEEAKPIVDSYLEGLHAQGPVDSIHTQCYNAARIHWRTLSPAAGISKGEEIMHWVMQHDPDTAHHLLVLNDMSWIYYETGQGDRCIEVDSLYLNIAKSFSRASGKDLNTGYHNLGFYHMKSGRFEKAYQHFKRAAEVLEEKGTKDFIAQIKSTNAVGASLYRMGRLSEAIGFYEKCLSLTDSVEQGMSYSLKGSALNNLMLVSWQRRDYLQAKQYAEQAIESHEQAIQTLDDLSEKEVSQKHLSEVYTNLALLYESLGDYWTAHKLLDHVLQQRVAGMSEDDPYVQGAKESMLGLKMLMGEADEDMKQQYEDYLSYCLKKFGKASFYTNVAHNNLSGYHRLVGQYDSALYHLDLALESQSLANSGDTDIDLAEVYENRAEIHALLKDLQAARKDQMSAHELYKKGRGVDPVLVRNSMDITQTSLLMDDLESAELWLARSLGQLQILQDSIPSQLDKGLLARAEHLQAELALRSDEPSSRSQALDHVLKAITFLEENLSTHADPKAQSILYQEHSRIFDLAKSIAFADYQKHGSSESLDRFLSMTEQDRTTMLRKRLQNFSALSFQGVPDSLLAKETDLLSYLGSTEDMGLEVEELFDMEEEFRALKTQLREEYPEYYRLKYEQIEMEVSDIQTELLNEGQAMIIYSIVDDKVYIMAIEKDDVHLHSVSIPDLTTRINQLDSSIRNGKTEDFISTSSFLFEKLVRPFYAELEADEFLIVPDEDLFFLNFELLLTEPASASDYIDELLIQDKVISYHLSAHTALGFHDIYKSNSKAVLALAPGFSDELKANYTSTVTDDLEKDEHFLKAVQQPFALKTAENIAALMKGKPLLADEATETRFKEEAEQYGIVHLGTHAELSKHSPLLSRLMLSKSQGDDGYLHAYEIYELPLRAELAVLSACETGRGQKRSSEGVISLAHSFAYAGCPSIVMSLWDIDEQSTSVITEAFYQNLAEGQAKNEALRNAKLDWLNDHKSDEQLAPFYWAGLVLVGDESSIDIGDPFPLHWVLIGAGLGLAIILLYIQRRINSENG